jgi:hypothetical protein
VLRGQGPEHRGPHDPFEPVQLVDITGEQVVLDEPPVLGPERGDDGVAAFADEVTAMGWLALSPRPQPNRRSDHQPNIRAGQGLLRRSGP